MSGEIFELCDAEAALKSGDAVKTVTGLVFADDAPEIVAADSSFLSITHGGKMEQGGAGKLGAKF